MKCVHIPVIYFLCCCSSIFAYEGQRSNSVLLNGTWQFFRGQGDEQAYLPEKQLSHDWKSIRLPRHAFLPESKDVITNLKYIWAKRSFVVSEDQADSLAVLRWNRIAFGATAYINGRKVGYNEPTGPYQVILPKGVLKSGENQIVLKVTGPAAVRKSQSGYFLIPAGFSTPSCKGQTAVTDDVWIDFADRVYLKWVLAIPDLADSRVILRCTPVGPQPVDNLTITAAVKSWPDGKIVGTGKAAANLQPTDDPLGGKHFYVDVPLSTFKPWTHETRNLYIANVKVTRDKKILDELNFRFGMREITIADQNYKLNGKNLWLRGSNLVMEWNWADIITGKEKQYIVDEAREMSINSFRTHTQPPPPLWANIADEYGTMILAEFPTLYNYVDYKFTDKEQEIFRRNIMTDAAGWMARLWNHPSVIMWVLTNESMRGGVEREWEMGPFRNFVKKLDPTRPTMRTGDTGTEENYDVHTCGNIFTTHEGNLYLWFKDRQSKVKGRTYTNTEYMNKPPGKTFLHLTGNDNKDEQQMVYAQLGMEHTELMRRMRLDGIWPYMYAGWTKTRTNQEWKAGFAKPVSAAWHSSLSPVLASLDLFNANYLTGQEVTTDLYLINDSWHDASIRVDILLTDKDPEFIPEAECFKEPLAQWSHQFQIKADTIRKVPVQWKLPDKQGNYWLTARTTGIPGRPILSQRFVRAIEPPAVPPSAKKHTYVLLGRAPTATAFFESKNLRTTHSTDNLDPQKHMVIIWDAEKLTDEHKQAVKKLFNFAGRGGRIIVLAVRSWDWTQLCELRVEHVHTGGSRVFVYDKIDPPMLEGIDREWLKRWNGIPGDVALARITGPAVDIGKKIMWTRHPDHTVAAEVAATQGTGKILFCQLTIQNRLNPAKPSYDPVAERILLNMLKD